MRMSRFAALALLNLTIVCLTTSEAIARFSAGHEGFPWRNHGQPVRCHGSHSMMKSEGANDAKECTLKCVAMGGKFVLYDSANKAVYQLDDQEKVKQFAGQKVKVSGSFDAATKSIHVQNVQGWR